MDKKSRDLVMGKLYLKNKDYKMAEKSLLDYLNLSPDDFQALKMLAQVYENLNNHQKAFEFYERSYLVEPERKGTILDICRLLLVDNSGLDYVDRKKWLKLAIQAFPSNPIVTSLRDTLPVFESSSTPSRNNLESEMLTKLDRLDARLISIEEALAQLLSFQPAASQTAPLQSVTSKSATPQAVAPQPVTLQSDLSQPSPPRSAPPKPILSKPVTPNAVASQSLFQQPVPPEPIAPQLVPANLVTPQSLFPQPVPPEPVAPQSVPAKLVTPQSLFPQPVPPEPVAPLSVPPKPVTPQPISSQPSLFQSVLSQSISSQPSVKKEEKAPFSFGNTDGNFFASGLKKLNLPVEGGWTTTKTTTATTPVKDFSLFSFSTATEAPRSLFGNDEKEKEKGDEEEGDDGVVDAPEIPIENTCELQPIEIKSGEEDEDIVFQQRCKLFRFRDKEYKERGLGNIKILKHRSTSAGRLIMRRDQINLVCLNCWSCSKIERVRDTQVRFAGIDASDGEPVMTVFLAKFKTQELTDTFISHLNELFPAEEE